MGLAADLLLRDLVGNLTAVRAACVEVLAFRGTHGWPPALRPPPFWEELYAELAAGLELAEKTLEGAVHEARVDSSRRPLQRLETTEDGPRGHSRSTTDVTLIRPSPNRPNPGKLPYSHG